MASGEPGLTLDHVLFEAPSEHVLYPKVCGHDIAHDEHDGYTTKGARLFFFLFFDEIIPRTQRL